MALPFAPGLPDLRIDPSNMADLPKLHPGLAGEDAEALAVGAGMSESATISEPNDLRALVATMRTAKAQRVGMAIWDRDIEAIENAISIISAMRHMPRRDNEAAQRLAEWAGKLGPARS